MNWTVFGYLASSNGTGWCSFKIYFQIKLANTVDEYEKLASYFQKTIYFNHKWNTRLSETTVSIADDRKENIIGSLFHLGFANQLLRHLYTGRHQPLVSFIRTRNVSVGVVFYLLTLGACRQLPLYSSMTLEISLESAMIFRITSNFCVVCCM